MIRAVCFDLDNTLFDRAAVFRRYAAGLLARRIAAADRDALLQKMIACDDGNQHREFMLYSEHMTGAVPELGLSAAEYCADYVPGLLTAIEPDAATCAWLRRLAARFKLGLVTNGSSERQREKLRRLRLDACFGPEAILISGEVGVTKPAPLIFERAIQAAGCAANEIVFCGDDPERDIGGAAAAGMKTCWVYGLRLSRTFPDGVAQPDWQIERAAQIETVLP